MRFSRNKPAQNDNHGIVAECRNRAFGICTRILWRLSHRYGARRLRGIVTAMSVLVGILLLERVPSAAKESNPERQKIQRKALIWLEKIDLGHAVGTKRPAVARI